MTPNNYTKLTQKFQYWLIEDGLFFFFLKKNTLMIMVPTSPFYTVDKVFIIFILGEGLMRLSWQSIQYLLRQFTQNYKCQPHVVRRKSEDHQSY